MKTELQSAYIPTQRSAPDPDFLAMAQEFNTYPEPGRTDQLNAAVELFAQNMEEQGILWRAIDDLSKKFVDTSYIENTEAEPLRSYAIGPKQCGWLSEKKQLTVARQVSRTGKVFWYGDISGLSRATKIDQKLVTPRMKSKVDSIIAAHIETKLDDPSTRTRDLRPIPTDPTVTRLHAYKDDNVNPAGMRANTLRALVLEDTTGSEPVFLLGTVCLHNEQDKRIYSLVK